MAENIATVNAEEALVDNPKLEQVLIQKNDRFCPLRNNLLHRLDSLSLCNRFRLINFSSLRRWPRRLKPADRVILSLTKMCPLLQKKQKRLVRKRKRKRKWRFRYCLSTSGCTRHRRTDGINSWTYESGTTCNSSSHHRIVR